jgi:GGDEF domain-containing protein
MSRSGGDFLISIRKATDDLDRLAETINSVKATYVHALRSTAQYSIEFSAADAESFRDHLETICALAETASFPDDWLSIQASFRGELRDYRDRSVAQLTKFRADMKAAADAMEIFADSVVASSMDHRDGVQEALGKLDAVLAEESLAKVRDALVETKAEIGASIERMDHQHGLMIAQLRDEIRSLHQQIDADRRAQFTDRATGVWNRHKLDAQMEEMLKHDESFCVLVVGIRNLRRLDQRYSPAVVEGGVKALLQRLTAMLDDDATLGRWQEETFAAVLQIDPATAMSMSRKASKKLTGVYSVQENGLSRNIELHAVAGVIERERGMDTASFQRKLQQMAEVLSAA